MKEKYISATKLKAHYSWLGKDATLSPKDVDDIVDAQPAVEVERIVYGKWEVCTDEFIPKRRCTNCGTKFDLIAGEGQCAFAINNPKRCGECGAHMAVGKAE